MGTQDVSSGSSETRQEAQANLLQHAFHDSEPPIGISVAPEGYLYQTDAILVRDEYVARIQQFLDGGEPLNNRINGLTVLSLSGARLVEALAALDEIDGQFGVGVATPNHVLSITPASHCPATEPEETPATGPDPDVCPSRHAGTGVFVSVVDTGLLDNASTDHAWLTGVDGDTDPLTGGSVIPPYTGHGTFIAGVVRCMAPASELYVERVFEQAGGLLESDVVLQLYDALNRTPDIISLSAGTTTRNNLPLLSFEAFGRRLRDYKGIVLVAAAGNDGNRGPFWPAAFRWTVSVGALAANWRSRAQFSNHGGWVDVYAPGEGLVNAYATGTYECQEPPHAGEQRQFPRGMARWSGTSFSTPVVAGFIAARMSWTGENGRQAAKKVLGKARTQAIPGIGAVILPCPDDGDGHDRCTCRCRHGHCRACS
jgi:subtilisin family serine protease